MSSITKYITNIFSENNEINEDVDEFHVINNKLYVDLCEDEKYNQYIDEIYQLKEELNVARTQIKQQNIKYKSVINSLQKIIHSDFEEMIDKLNYINQSKLKNNKTLTRCNSNNSFFDKNIRKIERYDIKKEKKNNSEDVDISTENKQIYKKRITICILITIFSCSLLGLSIIRNNTI